MSNKKCEHETLRLPISASHYVYQGIDDYDDEKSCIKSTHWGVIIPGLISWLIGLVMTYKQIQLLYTVKVPERVQSWHENVHLSANHSSAFLSGRAVIG